MTKNEPKASRRIRGAHDSGAKSIGLNITLPHEQALNSYVSGDLAFSARYFTTCKMHLLMRPGQTLLCDL